MTTKEEADQRLKNDRIVKSLIVQRSRNFVRESMKNADRDIVFPNPPKPKGAYYDRKQFMATYLMSSTKPLQEGSLVQTFNLLSIRAPIGRKR